MANRFPWGTVNMSGMDFTGDPSASPKMASVVNMPPANFNGAPETPFMTDAQGANVGAAGIGAAATTGKAILDSIAQQNALDIKAREAHLGRQSTATISNTQRLEGAREDSQHHLLSSIQDQLQSGATQTDAHLGNQNNRDSAVSDMVNRIAQIYSR